MGNKHCRCTNAEATCQTRHAHNEPKTILQQMSFCVIYRCLGMNYESKGKY